MKKILKLMFIVTLGLSFLTACTNNSEKLNVDSNEATANLEVGADMSLYEEFKAKENMFIKTTAEDVLSLIENRKSAMVYFGFPDCPWCEDMLPVLNEAAKNKDYPILYVEARNEKGELNYSEEIKEKIYNEFDFTFETDENGKKIMYFPYVVRIENGVVTDSHVGTVDGHNAHERELTEEEKIALRKTYENMINVNVIKEE